MNYTSFIRSFLPFFDVAKPIKPDDDIIEDSAASVARYSRDEKPLSYTLKLQSFSLLNKAVSVSKTQRFESQIFNSGGYKWKLALYPNGDEKRNGSGHISLYLVLADPHILSTASEVKAVLTFLVYDKLEDKYFTIEDDKKRRFSAFNPEWGIDKFLPLATFNNSSNGYLVDDCCVFGVDIFVTKHGSDGEGEIFSLINPPKYRKYVWTLKNFSQLGKDNKNNAISAPFHVDNYRWKVSLYPKGDGSIQKEEFLSLFLMLDNFEDLPQNSQVYAEYELMISSQLGAHQHKGQYSSWFERGNTSWGTRNFISLTKLKDPTKSFICKDTVIIEVKINVISTFKKI